jgi:hypothetical protein
MKRIINKQLQSLKEYGGEAVEANAHIGLIFYIVVIGLGYLLYTTM